MRRPTVAVCAAAFTWLFASTALAQNTPSQAGYVEQKVDSGQAVIFKDDAMQAGGLDPNGYIIRVRGAFWRTALLRPRLNFVPELLHSGENL